MNTKFINVIDIECTCWPSPQEPTWKDGKGVSEFVDPAPMEIIEIGIAQIDVTEVNNYWLPRTSFDMLPDNDYSRFIKRGQLYVMPQLGNISEFCTKLTGITQETVDNSGRLLHDACIALRKEWNSGNYVWASWGDFDRNQFQRECRFKKVDYPFGPTHINAKQLFAIKHGLNKGVSEREALKVLDMEFEGQPHSGTDDAFNAAKLFINTLWG